MHKKKILFLSHCLKTGGGQLRLKDIVLGLDGDKYEKLLWAPLEGELKTDYENNNISVLIKDFRVDEINREKPFELTKNQKKKIKKIINTCKNTNKSLAIRCAGSITNKILEEFDLSSINVVGIFDNNPVLINKEIAGHNVYSASEIENKAPEVVILAHAVPEFLEKELKTQIKAKIYSPFAKSAIEKIKEYIGFCFILLKPAQMIAKYNPDVILLNNTRNFWAVLAAKLLNKKVIWIIRESFHPKTSKYYPQSLYFAAFKLADKVVFPSRATYDLLYKDFIDEKKVEIIHDGLILENMTEYKSEKLALQTKKELNIANDHKVISCIGTIEERKGQLYLIKAAVEFLNNRPGRNYTFILVGSRNDKYSQEIQEIIKKSGYESNFRILPVINPAYKFFNISDIFVCSSIIEAFPNVVLEAMYFENAIIATNIFGIPEAINHNKNGLLIPVENMENHIESALNYLVDNPDKMETFTKTACVDFIEDFTFKTMIEKFDNLI